MKKSLSTLFLVAVLIALIIGCSKLGSPIGTVENNDPVETASYGPAEDEAGDEPVVSEEEPPVLAPETEEGPLFDIKQTVTASQEEGFDKEIAAGADLDGDGVTDRIVLKTKTNPYYDEVISYVLFVNEEEISYEGSMIDPLFHVVNISSEDPYLEIAVSEEGPSSDFLTVFYRYKDRNLTRLSEIQGFLGKYPGTDTIGDVVLDGNGRITTKTRGAVIQTWFYDDSYLLTDEDQLVQEVKELYPLDTEVTLLKKLKTVPSRESSEEGYVFQIGERAVLAETDNREWVSIRNDKDEVFWFQIRNHSEMIGQEEEGYAYDYFEGLNMAD
ncbi:hypothetical protein ACHAL6_09715 [Proteiniclasticum sp. C24MP]|uniref:hypothetical protein n=1 Tax=Proteiniclasticum sp. C24MP TaxID=3374101 RepID=UPI0037542D58